MRARFIGIAIGLLLAGLVISSTRPSPSPVTVFHGRLLSECDGAIRSIVIQYCAGSEFTLPVYRQFLSALPADVNVYVLTPDAQDFANLRDAISPVSAHLISVVTGHAITCWSRDRWVTLSGIDDDVGRNLLLCPRAEDAAAVWPARTGDQRVAFDLADFLRDSSRSPGLLALRSPLDFDGGDFLADSENVFVTPAVAQRSVGRAVRDLDELRSALHERLGRKIILLDDVPQHHAGMFMASIGNRTMLVGDPRMGQALLPSMSPALLETLPGGADFSDATQRRFDRAAEQAAAVGYRVMRIPTLCSPDAKTYLTYVNGIMDQRAGQKHVYMPMYRGAETINAAAEKVWRDLGYTVTPIDCTSVFGKFGTLHCLVNVLERS